MISAATCTRIKVELYRWGLWLSPIAIDIGGIPAMHNGIQELPAGKFTLHVAGVFADGRPAHMHCHPLHSAAYSKRLLEADLAHTHTHTMSNPQC